MAINLKQKTKRIVVFFALLIGAHGAPYTDAATVQLPRTGQTVCYDAAGGVTACAGTGQDGDKLKGVALPVPRFTDNGDGTVNDNLTGLIWLKNANCWGAVTWQTGLTNANTLASGSCGLTDGSVASDWRMPNIVELESLVDLSQNNPAIPAGHPFSNVQDVYFTSSTMVGFPQYLVVVNMSAGVVGSSPNNKTVTSGYVWLVRAGQ